jgi:hypothetical protein
MADECRNGEDRLFFGQAAWKSTIGRRPYFESTGIVIGRRVAEFSGSGVRRIGVALFAYSFEVIGSDEQQMATLI